MIQSLLTSTGVDHKGSPAGKGVDHTMRLLSKGAPMGKGVLIIRYAYDARLRLLVRGVDHTLAPMLKCALMGKGC